MRQKIISVCIALTLITTAVGAASASATSGQMAAQYAGGDTVDSAYACTGGAVVGGAIGGVAGAYVSGGSLAVSGAKAGAGAGCFAGT